ncbi:hypothetical protein AKJ16_DCAP05169, partial [Drosera capensis]
MVLSFYSTKLNPSFFSWPRFVEFCLTRSLGDHSPASHLAALLSYLVWILYGRKVTALVLLEIIFVGIVATSVLTLVPDTKLRSHIIGMIAMSCQFGTYASPILHM